MKTLQFSNLTRALLTSRRAWIFSAVMIGASAAQAAPINIQVWHTLADANKAEFEKLAKQYNKEQNQVDVSLKAFASQAQLEQATSVALKEKKAPNLLQLADTHSLDGAADYKFVQPMYELLTRHPIKDANWFVPATSSFVRDGRGRLLAFPWMAEVPIMFYNISAFKKAGLDPAKPARTWGDLQGALLKLRDAADMSCPYASSDQVVVHLENLAPVNGQEFTSNSNGLSVVNKKSAAPTLLFDTLYIRHISLMSSWKRSELFTAHTADNGADKLFAKGECGVLMANSGAMGQFLKTKSLSFGVAPLPYYEQATSSAGQPFVSGSALWAVKGQPQVEEKAVAAFLAWLSKPVIAAEWHQNTGYLPLTEAAFRASDVSFYKNIPGGQATAELMSARPTTHSRGFRMENYARIEPILSRELDAAFDGKTPPMAALNSAASQARTLASQR